MCTAHAKTKSDITLKMPLSTCRYSFVVDDWKQCEILVEELNDFNLLLHSHHQNNFCIKMGSDESHLMFSLTVRDKVTRQCPQIYKKWSWNQVKWGKSWQNLAVLLVWFLHGEKKAYKKWLWNSPIPLLTPAGQYECHQQPPTGLWKQPRASWQPLWVMCSSLQTLARARTLESRFPSQGAAHAGFATLTFAFNNENYGHLHGVESWKVDYALVKFLFFPLWMIKEKEKQVCVTMFLVSWFFEPSQPHTVISGLTV